MYWSRVSECVGCVFGFVICIVGMYCACFGVACVDLPFELRECIGRVLQNVLVACWDLSVALLECIGRAFPYVLVACSDLSFELS